MRAKVRVCAAMLHRYQPVASLGTRVTLRAANHSMLAQDLGIWHMVLMLKRGTAANTTMQIASTVGDSPATADSPGPGMTDEHPEQPDFDAGTKLSNGNGGGVSSGAAGHELR
jgi:hypothetical protein